MGLLLHSVLRFVHVLEVIQTRSALIFAVCVSYFERIHLCQFTVSSSLFFPAEKLPSGLSRNPNVLFGVPSPGEGFRFLSVRFPLPHLSS